MPELLTNLTAALQHPLDIHWTDKSMLSILICTGLYIMGLCVYASEQRRTRDGEEHGSAAWGSPRQVNAMFRQKENKILTRHVRLGLDTHKHRRSLNVLRLRPAAMSSQTFWRPTPIMSLPTRKWRCSQPPEGG